MDTRYETLKADYAKALGELKITREQLLVRQARHILGIMGRYTAVGDSTGIPPVWIAAIDYRESENSPYSYLGNGQPWYRVTTEVPAGRGPFKSWEEGAIDALSHIKWDQPTSLEYCAFQGENWNGWGYRRRGVTNPYLWAGTTIYTGGMFTADGVYTHDASDKRLGIIPLMIVLGELDPSLAVEFFDAGTVVTS